jgi:hypothetical protein
LTLQNSWKYTLLRTEGVRSNKDLACSRSLASYDKHWRDIARVFSFMHVSLYHFTIFLSFSCETYCDPRPESFSVFRPSIIMARTWLLQPTPFIIHKPCTVRCLWATLTDEAHHISEEPHRLCVPFENLNFHRLRSRGKPRHIFFTKLTRKPHDWSVQEMQPVEPSVANDWARAQPKTIWDNFRSIHWQLAMQNHSVVFFFFWEKNHSVVNYFKKLITDLQYSSVAREKMLNHGGYD